METFLIKALQLIVALVLLVIVHEFGHYIFARIFGVKVNRFYIFFNPWFSLLKWYPDKGKLEIIAWTKKEIEPDPLDPKKDVVKSETPKALLTLNVGKPKPAVNKKGRPSWRSTLYGIGWVPLGGYCDIAGMVDETKSAAELEAEPQEWEFRTKAAWKRFCIMAAGVTFNFLLAIAIYAGIAFHWGDRVVPFQQAYEGMDYSEPMQNVGLQNGDILLSINGRDADAKSSKTQWDMVQSGATITVLRNHCDTLTFTVPSKTLEEVAKLKSGLMAYRLPVVIDKLQPGLPAAKAGLEEGDRIVKVGNDTTPAISEFIPALEANKGKTTDLTVVRDGRDIVIPVDISDGGKIGIQMMSGEAIYNDVVEEINYGFFAAIPRGVELGVNQLTTYVSSLKLLFTKEGAQQVGGFGTIGSLFPERWNWYSFWQITAFLSVILAFMNIIPIPGLDGGYILFLFWEMITRRKVSDKVLEWANTIGFAFLLMLLIYANGADIFRFFVK